MKKDEKDTGGRCIRGKDGKLGFSEIDKKIWRNHMNKENNWDHMTGASMVKEAIEKVIHEEKVIATKVM